MTRRLARSSPSAGPPKSPVLKHWTNLKRRRLNSRNMQIPIPKLPWGRKSTSCTFRTPVQNKPWRIWSHDRILWLNPFWKGLNMNRQMLKIWSDFPKISLTDIENKTITIPDDINTKFCILLFFRGAWWPKCTLQLEGYRKHSILFERLGASIVAANVDSLEDTKLAAVGKRFPNRKKAMPFTFCYGVTPEIAQTLGAYWSIIQREKTNTILWGKAKIICNRQNL